MVTTAFAATSGRRPEVILIGLVTVAGHGHAAMITKTMVTKTMVAGDGQRVDGLVGDVGWGWAFSRATRVTLSLVGGADRRKGGR
jgi:hypothetical protein